MPIWRILFKEWRSLTSYCSSSDYFRLFTWLVVCKTWFYLFLTLSDLSILTSRSLNHRYTIFFLILISQGANFYLIPGFSLILISYKKYNFIILAWSAWAERSFTTSSSSTTDAQREECFSTIRSLAQCPVPQSLEVLPKIHNHCKRMGIVADPDIQEQLSIWNCNQR